MLARVLTFRSAPLFRNVDRKRNGASPAVGGLFRCFGHFKVLGAKDSICRCILFGASARNRGESEMQSKNSERLKRYKSRLKAAGFRRLSVWVSAELIETISTQRLPAECRGRTLERLLLGDIARRPEYRTDAELRDGRQGRTVTSSARARECGHAYERPDVATTLFGSRSR